MENYIVPMALRLADGSVLFAKMPGLLAVDQLRSTAFRDGDISQLLEFMERYESSDFVTQGQIILVDQVNRQIFDWNKFLQVNPVSDYSIGLTDTTPSRMHLKKLAEFSERFISASYYSPITNQRFPLPFDAPLDHKGYTSLKSLAETQENARKAARKPSLLKRISAKICGEPVIDSSPGLVISFELDYPAWTYRSRLDPKESITHSDVVSLVQQYAIASSKLLESQSLSSASQLTPST